MSNVANHAATFYKQVAATGTLWTLRDSTGFPAPKNDGGQRAQPFWSSHSRAELVIKGSPAYGRFQPVEISWQDFKDKWAPRLACDGVLVGINWAGSKAKGYEVTSAEVIAYVEPLRDSAL